MNIFFKAFKQIKPALEISRRLACRSMYDYHPQSEYNCKYKRIDPENIKLILK